MKKERVVRIGENYLSELEDNHRFLTDVCKYIFDTLNDDCLKDLSNKMLPVALKMGIEEGESLKRKCAC